jgi:hypothetical protein
MQWSLTEVLIIINQKLYDIYLRINLTYVTNSASRWRKIAKNLPQDLIHYTITITWFLTDSHTKVTSPRTARKKAAQNLRLHIIRIRHCDECICRWVWSFAQLGCSRRSRNIFCNVAHTTVLKETSSLLRFHFQRCSLSCRSKLVQVARWPSGLPPRFGCPLWLRRSAMAKRKSGGCRFSKFFVWATFQNLFPVTSKHSSCAKTQTQRQMHSSQWRIRMIWSLSFCAAFFLAVRGDVTFVWESVTNHVIWIVYLININYVTIR